MKLEIKYKRGQVGKLWIGIVDTTSNKFVQNFGYAMSVLDNDPSHRNPFDSSDQAFNQDWDPPLPTNIRRVHCGIQGSLNTNPIMCYGPLGVRNQCLCYSQRSKSLEFFY